MEFRQIATIVNNAVEQMDGTKNVILTPTDFVSLGNTLYDQSKVDKFFGVLADRIYNTIVSVRGYSADNRGVFKDSAEYGCLLQKLYVDMPNAVDNTAIEISNPKYDPTKQMEVVIPVVKQKLFDKVTACKIKFTLPDNLLKSAFNGPAEMAAFIEGVFMVMENRLEIVFEANINLTRANFIAQKFDSNRPMACINLLDKYNVKKGLNLDVEDAMENTEFLKWASRQILLYTKRMRKMGTWFNEEGYNRFTPSDKLVVDILQDFSTAVTTFLQSDTYHDELVALPNYNEVAYWQGAGQDFDFDNTSKISLGIEDASGADVSGHTVTKTGIIAFLYDYDALGMTIKEVTSSAVHYDEDEYTNYATKPKVGYFNDLSENAIVFYLEHVDHSNNGN